MADPKKNRDDKNPDEDFKEFQVAHLAGRVYKDGRVKIGALVYDSVSPDKPKLEVEITTNTKIGREFTEKLMGLINQQEGRY